MAAQIFVSFGSNIEPERNLPQAVRFLSAEVRVLRASRVYESIPIGSSGANFLNAALLIEAETPPALFKWGILRPIEARLGRVRTADKNAPRTIDLDLSLYGNLVLDDPVNKLVLPDPDILTRAHIALPLADLDPDYVHPITGETLGAIAARFEDQPGISLHPQVLS